MRISDWSSDVCSSDLALLMYNIDSYSIDSDLPNRYQTLAARLRYNIGNKYLLEAAASYSGNNRYEEGNRFGLFPAFGAAWNMHEEAFFPEDSWISALKIRASYGLTGNAVAGDRKSTRLNSGH